MPISNFQPIRLLDPGCWYKFIYLMANSADPTDLDLHCLQRQDISGFSRTRANQVPIRNHWLTKSDVCSFKESFVHQKYHIYPKALIFYINWYYFFYSVVWILGPFVEIVVILTSSLRVKILTVLVSTISNSQAFLLKKCKLLIFFQQKY